jgi:hypothetical protein
MSEAAQPTPEDAKPLTRHVINMEFVDKNIVSALLRHTKKLQEIFRIDHKHENWVGVSTHNRAESHGIVTTFRMVALESEPSHPDLAVIRAALNLFDWLKLANIDRPHLQYAGISSHDSDSDFHPFESRTEETELFFRGLYIANNSRSLTVEDLTS